jgi:hypothetical protein
MLKEYFLTKHGKIIRKNNNIQYIYIENGETHKILRLENFMSISSDKDDKFFLILKNSKTPMGIPAKELVDTIETTMDLDKNSYKNQYVSGTKLLDNKITIFLDVDKFKNDAEGVV